MVRLGSVTILAQVAVVHKVTVKQPQFCRSPARFVGHRLASFPCPCVCRSRPQRLLRPSLLTSFSHSHKIFALMVWMTPCIRLSQTQILTSPSSANSGNGMCPPLGNLTSNVANGINGASAPYSSGIPIEHLVRELACQITHQNKRFSGHFPRCRGRPVNASASTVCRHQQNPRVFASEHGCFRVSLRHFR